MWIVHICLYMLPESPIHPLLNAFLLGVHIDGFALFSTVVFGFYAIYLLVCVIKGSFKMGIQLPGIVKLYPMELANTRMNSFLMNVWLILVCSVPTVQFCGQAFSMFARNTEISL